MRMLEAAASDLALDEIILCFLAFIFLFLLATWSVIPTSYGVNHSTTSSRGQELRGFCWMKECRARNESVVVSFITVSFHHIPFS